LVETAIVEFEANFTFEKMKKVVKLKGAQEDSTETMYLNIARFKEFLETGKVVKVAMIVYKTSEDSS